MLVKLLALCFFVLFSCGGTFARGGSLDKNGTPESAQKKSDSLNARQHILIAGPPFQADPGMLDFVRATAHRLKDEWQRQGMPLWPHAFAEFKYSQGKNTWQVSASENDPTDDNRSNPRVLPQSKVAACNLATTKALAHLTPPKEDGFKSVSMTFEFASYSPGLARKLKGPLKKKHACFPLLMLQDQLKSNWKAKLPDKESSCDYSFTIRTDGTIVDPKLEKSSQDASYDQAALEALKAIRCLPLPQDAPAEHILMTFMTEKWRYRNETLPFPNGKTKELILF